MIITSWNTYKFKRTQVISNWIPFWLCVNRGNDAQFLRFLWLFCLLLLLWGFVKAVWHFLVVSVQTARGRLHRATNKSKYFLVLCLQCAIHGAIDDGVDGTTQEPQASGEDEDLKREENSCLSYNPISLSKESIESSYKLAYNQRKIWLGWERCVIFIGWDRPLSIY